MIVWLEFAVEDFSKLKTNTNYSIIDLFYIYITLRYFFMNGLIILYYSSLYLHYFH